MSEDASLVKICVGIKRNPKITEEEFHKHWVEVTGPLITPWLVKHGVLRYNQYHTTNKSKKIAQESGYPMSQFDGIAYYWVRSTQDWLNAMNDPYYKEKVKPDQQYLTDESALLVTVGREITLVQTGAAVDKKNIWSDYDNGNTTGSASKL